MFHVTMIPCLLRSLKLRLQDEDDDTQRIVDSTFRVPVLSYPLAGATPLPLAAHCFGKDQLPLWGVHDVKFTPPEAQYTVLLHSVPDLPDQRLELAGVTVVKVRVWRPKEDRRDLALEFTTRHELARGDAKDLGDLIAIWAFGQTHVSFAEMQIPLDLAPSDTDTPHARAH